MGCWKIGIPLGCGFKYSNRWQRSPRIACGNRDKRTAVNAPRSAPSVTNTATVANDYDSNSNNDSSSSPTGVQIVADLAHLHRVSWDIVSGAEVDPAEG